MRAHEPLLDADRAKELSIEISRKLVELAADGVTDPAQLRRLTLETLPLSPVHEPNLPDSALPQWRSASG